jgi:8-oxo-dGTP pyrophosphatase MutT (NUDIX family)
LSTVDSERLRPALVAELADAETRVLIARRFHNDAVRDTLALRVRRPVRWLRLGGTAPMPTYFEIIDRQGAGTEDPALANFRTSARIILLDEDGRVLLLRGFDPAAPSPAVHWWFTVGGQTLPGEKLCDGAVRELVEETGLSVPSGRLVGPLWRRVAVFDFNGTTIRSEELFFVHRTKRFEPATDGRTNLEQRYITGHRWCDAEDIAALAASGEQVFPNQLGELLGEAATAADAVAAGGRRDPILIG